MKFLTLFLVCSLSLSSVTFASQLRDLTRKDVQSAADLKLTGVCKAFDKSGLDDATKFEYFDVTHAECLKIGAFHGYDSVEFVANSAQAKAVEFDYNKGACDLSCSGTDSACSKKWPHCTCVPVAGGLGDKCI